MLSHLRGHCSHPYIRSCSRHVSPRISGERDCRPSGETAYGEGVSSRGSRGASCSSANVPAPSATNSHPPLVPGGALPYPSPPTAEDNSDSASGTVRVFRSQYASLLQVAPRHTVNIFLLQETLLPERSTTTLPGYRAYHCPWVRHAGGGLAILARHSIACQQDQHPLSCGEGAEVQAVTLRFSTPRTYNL